MKQTFENTQCDLLELRMFQIRSFKFKTEIPNNFNNQLVRIAMWTSP